MRVAFDHQIFSLQNYGGISRYFARIAEQMVGAGNDVGIFSPLHRNAYLKELPEGIVRGRWMEKYPPHTARLILAYNRLKGRSEMSRWQPQIVHETYYSRRPSFISEKCPVVLTVYDMIHELYPESFSSQDETTALKQQAVELAVVLATQAQAVHVGKPLAQQYTGLLRLLSVDQARQLTNAAAFPEAA